LELINCSVCGKMILKNREGMCPGCAEEEYHDFVKVRDFVYDHPKARIPEVSETTGISYEKIFNWVREGRLLIK
jgi:predicted amidophosphoribosyltransferase